MLRLGNRKFLPHFKSVSEVKPSIKTQFSVCSQPLADCQGDYHGAIAAEKQFVKGTEDAPKKSGSLLILGRVLPIPTPALLTSSACTWSHTRTHAHTHTPAILFIRSHRKENIETIPSLIPSFKIFTHTHARTHTLINRQTYHIWVFSSLFFLPFFLLYCHFHYGY